jgi:class 3 adenylate cyclase/tetratricopeptide (TPR) repeat protein
MCPKCSFDSPPEMNFCGRCGANLKQSCRACNFANPLDYRFCGMCGASLAGDSGPEPLPDSEAAIAPALPEIMVAAPPVTLRRLTGERRPATVVVADVVRSTDLLQQIGSEAWVEIMSQALQLLEAQVYRFGGEVDQFRGDGLLAFFGARSAHEDDAERAILAALGMQEAIGAYAAELARDEGIELRLRVGVNTGEVITTAIGDSRQHREDTAMGEAISLAVRLENAAEPGTVLVGESSYHLAEPHFEWRVMGKITVKGIGQPLAGYRPLSARPETRQRRGLEVYGLSAPLIGREVEFRLLLHKVEGLASGRGGIVTVTGEQGVGKSYLVSETRRHILRDYALLSAVTNRRNEDTRQVASPVTWLSGRCRSYEHSWPYSVWLRMLRGWLGWREAERPVETAERLQQQAESLWADEWTQHYPFLAAFLSLPLPEPFGDVVKQLDAGGLRGRIYVAVRKWLEALARRTSLALVFDDLQWADPSSLDLLLYCLPLCDQEAVLWLMLFEQDSTPAITDLRQRIETGYPHRLTSLAVPPLSEAQSHEMIDRLIGPEALPAETRSLLIGKAESNPYYIEELIRSLIEQGILEQDVVVGQWRATRTIASLDLPDTLQSLLVARIDRLPPEERRVLQVAAVTGHTFWFNALQAVFEDATRLKEHLATLQRAQLVGERGCVPDLGMEYTFRSNLIREVAYESVLSSQRIAYHRQVADHLEFQFGREVPLQYYSILAYHYRQAGEQKKELFYTRLAAQQAQAIYANTAAMELHTRALELLEQLEHIEGKASDENRRHAITAQRFEVLNERLELFYLTGGFEAARGDARILLELARQLPDHPAWLIDALLQQPGVKAWSSQEELQAGLALAEEALSLSRQLQDRRREMQCLYTISGQRHFLKHPSWQETADQALALARQLDDRRYQVLILTYTGSAYSWSNQPERGMAYLETALPICRDLGDRITEVHLWHQTGLRAERLGDYYCLLTEHHQKALKISREIGYRDGEASALMWCGQTQAIYLGDMAGGLDLLQESIRFRQEGARELLGLLRFIQIYAGQGKHEEALSLLERGRRIRDEDLVDIGRAGLRLVAAMLYNALGDADHLRLALDAAAEAGRLVAHNPFVTRQYEIAAACQAVAAHLGLAGCTTTEAEQQFHCQQALELSQKALAIYHSLGFVQIIECVSEEILWRHSQALAANGRYAEATGYRQQAYDETMRKHDLIPADTPFRHTFLENVPLHREICHLAEEQPVSERKAEA